MKKKLILISVSIKKPYRNRYGSFFFSGGKSDAYRKAKWDKMKGWRSSYPI